VTFGLDVTGSEDANVGSHDIGFEIFRFNPSFERFDGHLTFELVAPSCFVFKRKELMITHTSVVDDPARAASPSGGVWTLGGLMRAIAPTPDDAPAMTEQLFQTWLTNQTVNGFVVEARPAMQQTVLDVWPRTPDGMLDLDRAPFTLQAIVNRTDLRDVAAGSAGQGRLVYALNNFFGSFSALTVIVEFNLPATSQQEVLDWANRWHGLSSIAFPSEDYNRALETITQRFAGRNASPGSVNGSALVSLRTNENILSPIGRWELRQFELSRDTGFFQPATVTETPDIGFNGTQAFADFVNQNATAIIAELPGAVASSTVPLEFQGRASGRDRRSTIFSMVGGRHRSSEARSYLAQHVQRLPWRDGTSFVRSLPISRRSHAGRIRRESLCSTPSPQVRTLNDQRRKDDLTSLVCPPLVAPLR
jgi:hypothetical protein